MEINKMNLTEFLVKSKKNTYAGNGEEIKLNDGGKELVYEDGIFKYRDRYYRFNPFIGQELVWQSNELVWGMNYYGRVFSKRAAGKITEEKVYEFLREALKNVSANAPYRGPSRFESENLLYLCNFDGDSNRFKGNEFIHHRQINIRIYLLDFHGGIIK